jgi:soluble cytochrome b562
MQGKGLSEAYNEAKANMANPQADPNAALPQRFVENALKDPATPATLPIGGPEAGLAAKGLKGLGEAAMTGLKQGVVSAGVHQADREAAGQGTDLGQVTAEVGGSALLGGLASKIPAIAEGYNYLTGKTVQAATGVPEEALRMAGSEEGRAALEDASGQQHEIGQALVDRINNAYDIIKETPAPAEALENVPAVNVVPIIKNLEAAAGNPKTKELQAAASQIQGKADELRQMAVDAGQGGYVNASDLYDYRKEIDQVIGDEFGKSSGKYINALKSARFDIKNGLLGVAKGTDYEQGMQELSDKLDAVDKMKMMLGKSEDTQNGRAESFIRNINNLGKGQQQEWLNNFQNVFGGDYLNQAKTATLAERLGPEGKAGLLPEHKTGAALKGMIAGTALGSPLMGLAASSPLAASRVILPATQGLENAAASPSAELAGRGLSQAARSNIAPPAPVKAPKNYKTLAQDDPLSLIGAR